MKIVIFFLLACVAFFLFEGVQFLWRIRESAHVSARATIFSREIHSASYAILVAGDSTAVGTGAVRAEESIAGRLGGEFPSVSITNVGENGLRLKEVLERLKNLEGKRFELVVIQAGGNDVVRLTSFKELEKNLEEVLLEAKKIGDQVAFLPAGNVGLSPIFPWPLNWFLTLRSRVAHAIYLRQVAKHDIIFGDFFNEQKDDIFATDIKRYYAPDVFHPSGEGYRLWYETFRKALKKGDIQIPN